MASNNTMHEYLSWRGDLSFAADPFNEVDNLILAQLAYVDYDGVVGSTRDNPMPVGEVCRKYWEMHTEKEIRSRESFVKLSPFLLKPVANSRRFGEMKVSGYVNYISKDREAQMSAIQFDLSDGTVYVAYRGTDDTIVGWKEDFNLSYMSRTEGQRLAVEYLEKNFAHTSLKLRVGGHSKGGNFAVFASAFAGPDVRRQVHEVYTNDGPGFREEITDTEEYKDVLKKTRGIIPAYSIIGKLLSSGLKSKIVKSSGNGIMQHNALTWQIMGNHFQYTERANDSIFFENVIDDWIKNVDDDARRLFVDQVFGILDATGASTMKDVKTVGLSDLGEVVSMFRKVPKERQKEFSSVLGQLMRSGEKNFFGQIGDNGEIPEVIRKWAAKRENDIEAHQNELKALLDKDEEMIEKGLKAAEKVVEAETGKAEALAGKPEAAHGKGEAPAEQAETAPAQEEAPAEQAETAPAQEKASAEQAETAPVQEEAPAEQAETAPAQEKAPAEQAETAEEHNETDGGGESYG